MLAHQTMLVKNLEKIIKGVPKEERCFGGSYQLDAMLLKTPAMPAINHMSHMNPSVDSSINRLSTLVSSHRATKFVTRLSAAPAINHDDAVEAGIPVTSSTYVK